MQRILMLLSQVALPDTITQHGGKIFFRSSVLHNSQGDIVSEALISCPTKAVNEVIEKYGQGHEAIPFVMPLLTMVYPKQS